MGGGVMGSSIAYHLSLMGCKNVTVVEKDPCYKHASAMLSVSTSIFCTTGDHYMFLSCVFMVP
jgi:2-polyprenyl-6-methoxyphenol hydroxylase-like FAD-dependent oxidoreductase